MGGLQEFAFKETQNYHVRFPFKNPISVTEPLRVDCVLDAPKTLSFFFYSTITFFADRSSLKILYSRVSGLNCYLYDKTS